MKNGYSKGTERAKVGENALLARMPARAEPARSLACRLYTLCERKGWAEEVPAYNERQRVECHRTGRW